MADADVQVYKAAVGLLVDYVKGTRSQVARHLVARQAFLRAFLGDERVGRFFDDWLDRIDLVRLRAHLEIRVLIEKADHWSDGDAYALRNGVDLWSDPRLLESLPSPDAGADGICGGPFERALIEVGVPSGERPFDGESDWPDFAVETARFVVGLNVPYPWLVLALLREFLRRFVLFERIDDPSPLTMTRWGNVRWKSDGWKQREAGPPDPLRFVADPDIPDVEGSMRTMLDRRARWFYRSVVRGDSIRTIARTEFGTEDGDRRKDVRVGVEAIRHLFELRPRSGAELSTNGWMVLALDAALSR